jgi:mono/diheme cytochrome c family protein
MKRLSEGQAIIVAISVASISLLVTFGLALTLSRPVSASTREKIQSRPPSKDAAVEGGRLFLRYCAECHGLAGQGGDEGPDLYDLREGDILIRQIIAGGVKKEMPPFGKLLSDSDVKALTAYLRTLRH